LAEKSKPILDWKQIMAQFITMLEQKWNIN